MALKLTQQNEVLFALKHGGLDPGEFQWASGSVMIANGGQATIFHSTRARFEFAYWNQNWFVYFEPGEDGPFDGPRQMGSWPSAMNAVLTWAKSLSEELQAPDLWGELARERQLLTQPNESGEAGNTPFTSEELALISRQIAELKRYVTESLALNDVQRRLLEARLDHVERAAPHTGRIDWWNQLTGALLNLVLTSVIPPAAVQGLLVLAGHGLASLFAVGPPQLLP